MDYNVKQLSDYSDECLLNEIKRIAQKIGKDTMYYKEFKLAGGRVSGSVFKKRFGSWSAALKKAGLKESLLMNISDEDLFAEISKLWDQLGRPPGKRDMNRMGRFSEGPL